MTRENVKSKKKWMTQQVSQSQVCHLKVISEGSKANRRKRKEPNKYFCFCLCLYFNLNEVNQRHTVTSSPPQQLLEAQCTFGPQEPGSKFRPGWTDESKSRVQGESERQMGRRWGVGLAQHFLQRMIASGIWNQRSTTKKVVAKISRKLSKLDVMHPAKTTGEGLEVKSFYFHCFSIRQWPDLHNPTMGNGNF